MGSQDIRGSVLQHDVPVSCSADSETVREGENAVVGRGEHTGVPLLETEVGLDLRATVYLIIIGFLDLVWNVAVFIDSISLPKIVIFDN